MSSAPISGSCAPRQPERLEGEPGAAAAPYEEQIEGGPGGLGAQPFIHFYVVGTPEMKIHPVFAHAILPYNETGKVVGLEFSPHDSFPLDIGNLENPNALSWQSVHLAAYDRSGDLGEWRELRTKVRRVLINYRTPEPTTFADNLALSACALGIVTLCKTTFPNMMPLESAFTWHRGAERFDLDSMLNPESQKLVGQAEI